MNDFKFGLKIAIFLGILAYLTCPPFQDYMNGVKPEQQKQIEKPIDIKQPFDTGAYLETRLLEIPADDSGQWTLIYMTSDDDKPNQAEKDLSEWLDTDKHLLKLKEQTHFFHYGSESNMYKTRFKRFYGSNYPVIALQTDKGKVIFKASGENIPTTVEGLVYGIDNAIEQCTPGRDCDAKKKPFRLVPDEIEVVHTIPDMGIEKGVGGVIRRVEELFKKWGIIIILVLGAIFFLNEKEVKKL